MSAARGTLTIAEMQGRDLTRRRLAVVMLAGLPLVLYLSIPPGEGWELVPGVVGLSWSIGGVAMFSALGWREVDPRLSLAGYGGTPQLLGRLAPLAVLGLGLGLVMTLLVLVRSDPADAGALVLAVFTTVMVGPPLGLAIGALLARELEGMLALIGIGGVAMSVPPELAGAPVLPLWGPMRLLVTASEGDGASAAWPLVHAVVSVAVLGALTWWAWRRRVQVR